MGLIENGGKGEILPCALGSAMGSRGQLRHLQALPDSCRLFKRHCKRLIAVPRQLLDLQSLKIRMSVETVTDSDTSRDLESSGKSCKGIRQSSALSHAAEMQFYPAGSLTSHKDSLLSSDEDTVNPGRKAYPRLLSAAHSGYFQPTRENVIVFEVASGAETGEVAGEEEGQPCYANLSWMETKKSGENVDFGEMERRDRSVAHLHQVISQQKSLIQGLRQRPEGRDKSCMTLSGESQQELEREVEHLTSACKRYERQNHELRTELQSCTSDLMQLDQAKSRLQRELRKTQAKADSLEANWSTLAACVDSILSQKEEETRLSVPAKGTELVSYVCSRVEMLGAKYTRLLAAYSQLTEQEEALKLQAGRGSGQKQAQLDSLKGRSTRSLKDKFVKQLESTISAYKEQLSALQDQWSEDEALPALAQTEQFNKLRGRREDVQPFRSEQGSPERLSPAASPARSPELAGKSRGSEGDVQPVDTRQSRLSEEGDISEGQVLKPENSVQTQRAVWTAKQGQRSFQGPSVQQKQQKERFHPVLLVQKPAKEPAFSIGKAGEGRKGCFSPVQTAKLSDTQCSKGYSTAVAKTRGVKSTSAEPRKASCEAEQKSKLRQVRGSK